MNLALARFISPDHCNPGIFDEYQQAWTESGYNGTPNRMLAIAGFCAETQVEAELLAGTAAYRKMMMQMGRLEGLISPEEVQDRRKNFSPSQEAEYMHTLEGYTVGSAERCQSEIADLAKAFGTDEIAVVTVTYDIAARMESYRLLAS
jgi:alkanesulfonate monooxygenase SsuD/methylene tetrahydromethanopterin reductase-like flavin-dependent oxidoreductase (luciferase family)